MTPPASPQLKNTNKNNRRVLSSLSSPSLLSHYQTPCRNANANDSSNEAAITEVRALLVGALRLDPDQRLNIDAIADNQWLAAPPPSSDGDSDEDQAYLRISRLTIDDNMQNSIPNNDQNATLRRDELSSVNTFYDFPPNNNNNNNSNNDVNNNAESAGPRSRQRSPYPPRFSAETSGEYTLPAMTICHLDDSQFVRRVFTAKLSMVFPCHRLVNFADSTSLIHIIMTSQLPAGATRRQQGSTTSSRPSSTAQAQHHHHHHHHQASAEVVSSNNHNKTESTNLSNTTNTTAARHQRRPPASSSSSSSRVLESKKDAPTTADLQLSEIRCCIFDEHIREDLTGSDLARMLIRLGYQGLILCMTACDDIVEQTGGVYDDFLSKDCTTPELHQRIVTAWKNKFGEAALVPNALLSTRGYKNFDPDDFRDIRAKCILQILKATRASLRHAELLDIKGDLESVRCPKYVLDVVRHLLDHTDVDSDVPFGRHSTLYRALETELLESRAPAHDRLNRGLWDGPPPPAHLNNPRRQHYHHASSPNLA